MFIDCRERGRDRETERERERERKREREKHQCERKAWIGCFMVIPDWGTNPQPFSAAPYNYPSR